MASEIRVNKISNRAGLSTVEYTDTGVIVSGIVTCTEISGLNALNIAGVSTFASPLDITGDIDVDGHTNLDNLSVAGVATFSSAVNATSFTGNLSGNVSGTTAVFDDFLNIGSNIKLGNAGVITATSYRGDGSQLTGVGIDTSQLDVNKLDVTGIATFKGGLNLIAPVGDYPSITAIDGNDKLVLRSNGLRINNQNGFRGLEFTGSSIHLYSGQMATHTLVLQTDAKGVKVGTGVTLETNGQATFSGIVTATSFSGTLAASNLTGALPAISGANLTNLPPSAPVGGASTNTVFFENDKEVAVNYQITSTKNAMTAGPVAINAGIAVTVPSGCAWTIV